MLAGPVGQLSTEDIRRDPAQSRQSQQQAEETAASWQVATQAAGVHFRTVDDFGVAAGQGIGELTTSVILYGESFEDVGKSILRSLIETTAQILITTAAVDGDAGCVQRHQPGRRRGRWRCCRRACRAGRARARRHPGLRHPGRSCTCCAPLLRPAAPCSRRCRAVRELRAAAWSA